MENEKEIVQEKLPLRRKIIWGIGILSVFAAIKAATRFPFSNKKDVIACKPESKGKTIKMLTQDGRLVEIDESLMTAEKKKITDHELQNWINKTGA